MNAADKVPFTALILKTWRFYGKTPIGEEVADWFGLLEDIPMAAVAAAFKRHLVDPKAGQYPPKPADIIRQLQPRAEDDGHPGADEAWGMLLRLIHDERETGVLTDQMRAGWAACQPILDAGDEIGARRCFIEAYQRHVQEARKIGRGAHWAITLGTDHKLRIQRLQEAIEARRIDFEAARCVLPGPTHASIDQVAGLLEGPDASLQDAMTAARLRALAAMLRSGSSEAEAETRRAAERQAQREQEDKKKKMIQNTIDRIEKKSNAA